MEKNRHEVSVQQGFSVFMMFILAIDALFFIRYYHTSTTILTATIVFINIAIILRYLTKKTLFKYVIDFDSKRLEAWYCSHLNKSVEKINYEMDTLSYSLKDEGSFRAHNNKIKVLRIYQDDKVIEEIVANFRGWDEVKFNNLVDALEKNNLKRNSQ